MGIQKNVEAVSFSEGNEVQRESFASKIMNVKIGVIPLPLYVVLAAIIYGASVYNKLPKRYDWWICSYYDHGDFLRRYWDENSNFKNIGGPKILSLFIPSLLVFLTG